VELRAEGLIKRHPGVLALDRVSITVQSGEVHAVVGENGAGKSTLMRVLSGATTPDAGRLSLDGRDVRFRSPHDAHALGIRMIHQELSLVPELSVAENICLGAEPARGGIVDRHRQVAVARRALERLGQPGLAVDARVATLPLAAQQMTEIAKAVAQHARMLLLDEPTAILAQDETESLFGVIRQLSAEGAAIVYISHRLDEIFQIADRVTVLRDGQVVSSDPIASLERSEIVRRMVGRELASGYPAAGVPPGREILRLEHVSTGPVRDALLQVRQGEIVALVGLVGAGRSELARAIFGAEPINAGEMFLDGRPFHPHSPRDAIRAGIGLLPEDRKRQGLVLLAAVRENVVMASAARLAHLGVIDRGGVRRVVQEWIDTLSIRLTSQDQPTRTLSGGNQQKVVLARWLLANSRLLLFDEPTRGIDVGAKAEIYALMRRLADNGAGILMVSSELPEALGMADRIIVLRQGRLVATLSRGRSEREVAALMLGEAAA
jgi:ribose transport system ATP-binding protein